MALSNSQFNSILREYERTQTRHRHELMDREEEVYAKIPEYKELESQVGDSAVARYRAIISGKEDATKTSLLHEITEISEKKATLLEKAGYPRDYLELKYDCPDCHDTGFIDGVKCHCFKAKAIQMLYAQSNIEKIINSENFEKLSYEYFDDTKVITKVGMTEKAYMHKVVDMCKIYTENFEKEHGNILFMGNTGVGKTYLSNCIAAELIKQYYSVIYLTATELFDVIGKVKIDKTHDLKLVELYDYILNCDMLIIDDLGSELSNTLTNSNMFYLINHRLIEKKSMVMSTNLSMNQLRDIYSERVTSRISSDFDVIPLYGEDIRNKK